MEPATKKKRVSFGGLSVDNPDQIRMDAEAQEAKGQKQVTKQVRMALHGGADCWALHFLMPFCSHLNLLLTS